MRARRMVPLLVGGALAYTVLWGVAFWNGQQVPFPDFAMFHTAGRLADGGRWADVYDVDRFAVAYEETIGVDPGTPTFGYPPPFAQALAPVAEHTSPTTAALLWTAFGLAAAGVVVWKLGLPRPLVFWVATSYPLVLTVSLGQNSLLSLAIVGAAVFLWLADRRFLAGVVLGLMVFKPQLLAAIGVFVILAPRRHLRVFLGSVTGASAVVLASVLASPDGWAAFPDGLRSLAAVGQNGFRIARVGVFDLAYLVVGAESWLAPVLGIVGAGIGIWWFVRYRRAVAGDLGLEIAGGVMLAMWVDPWTFVYEWLLLIVPLVLWWRSDRVPRAVLIPAFAVVLFAAAYTTPAAIGLLDWTGRAFSLGAVGLALAGWMIVRSVERPAATVDR